MKDNRLLVASHLSDKEYKFFLETYAKHNSSMGLEERKKYLLQDVVQVVRYKKDSVLKVYYSNGEWWHYTSENTWY